MEGFILLHRKFLNWEWYDDNRCMKLFIHCLLKANHKKKQWRGITIKRGEFITSRAKLAIETGLSEQQVRTAIEKLTSTNEITSKTTKINTCITVVNYDIYQQGNQQSNQVVTNEQPRSNQGVTTTNNDNNDKNDNNDNSRLSEIKISDVPDDEKKYFEIALYWWKLFKANMDDLSIKNATLEKAKYKKWIDPIRLMINNDNRTHAEFREVYDLLKNNEFWKKNILSTQKLREQFDKLLIESRTNKSKIIKKPEGW